MKKSIFCLVNNQEHADRLVEKLVSSNFIAEDISLLVAEGPSSTLRKVKNAHENRTLESTSTSTEYDKNRAHDLGTEDSTKAPEGSTTGAWAGGIMGGSLGLLTGMGAIAIPGLGAFVAAGPIVAALSGSAMGGVTGLLIGALVGYGIPEYEAKRYEEGIKGGKILLAVLARDSDQVENAKTIMQAAGAKNSSSSAQVKPPRV